MNTTGVPGDKTASPGHAQRRQALLLNISLQHSAFVAHAAVVQSSDGLWWCVNGWSAATTDYNRRPSEIIALPGHAEDTQVLASNISLQNSACFENPIRS